MFKALLISVLVISTLSRTYPLYKQCDSRWGPNQLGASPRDICQAGSLITSVAMALSGIGHYETPDTLNTWLKSHKGYVSGDEFVWSSINSLGLIFTGKAGNSKIKSQLDKGKVVICNVHNGGHWVLAHGYSGDNILVNDPGFSTTSYTLSQIVNGLNGIYIVG